MLNDSQFILTDSVVNVDDDNVAEGREHGAVVDVERGRAVHEAAAVDPDEHGEGRQRGAGASRRPHVDVQAVLALRRVRVPGLGAGEARLAAVHPLHAGGRARRRRVHHTRPRPDAARQPEAQRAHRRPPVRHAQPVHHLNTAETSCAAILHIRYLVCLRRVV